MRWLRRDPLYVAFSVAGHERELLEHLRKELGYARADPLARDLFAIGLRELNARFQPVPMKWLNRSTSPRSSARRMSAPARKAK